MTVIVLLINYPKSTITVVHWNDDSNETLFSSYLLGPLAKIFDVRIFVHLLAKTCAHLCAFLKNFDVRIFVRLLAKVCAHLSSELLVTLSTIVDQKQRDTKVGKLINVLS